MKTIYYYQTFVGLDKALTHIEDIDVINISSIHFGKDKDGNKSIYLNDNKPYDPLFIELWLQTEKAFNQGCTIMCMMGGAGFAYKELFSDFDTYYPFLRDLINNKSFIIDSYAITYKKPQHKNIEKRNESLEKQNESLEKQNESLEKQNEDKESKSNRRDEADQMAIDYFFDPEATRKISSELFRRSPW